MSRDRLLSGDQPVPDGFSDWAGYSYTGPRISPLRNLSTYNFSPVSYRPNLNFSTYKDWEDAVGRLQDFYDSKIRLAIDSAIRSGEADAHLNLYESEAADKMHVSWRVRGYGRQVFSSDFYSSSTEQAAELGAELRRRGAAYVSCLSVMTSDEIRAIINDTLIRLDKAKGAPFFQGGSDIEAGLALSCLSRKQCSFKKTEDILMTMSGGVKLRMLMSERIQGARKPASRKIVRDGRITAQGTAMLCKVRTVKAPPFVHNSNVAWFFNLHKTLMLRIWSRHHILQPIRAAEEMSHYRHSFSSDMSTFDDTISVETLDVWREAIAMPILRHLVNRQIISQSRADYFIDYDHSITRGEIICPARSIDEKACVLKMVGGVKSGERGTSSKDNDVSSARATILLRQIGSPEDSFLAWGDDLVILTNDRRLEERWQKSNLCRHLFVEKVAPGAVFLMKMSSYGHGLMMRSLSRRLNMEKREEPTTWIEQAVSLRASYEALTRPNQVRRPHCAAHLFFDAAAHTLGQSCPSVVLARNNSYRTLSQYYMATRLEVGQQRRFLSSKAADTMRQNDLMPEQEEAKLLTSSAVKGQHLVPGLMIPLIVREVQIDDLSKNLSIDAISRACRK